MDKNGHQWISGTQDFFLLGTVYTHLPTRHEHILLWECQLMYCLHGCFHRYSRIFICVVHYYPISLIFKETVESYKILLILPSVAETHPKMYLSKCNSQFSINIPAGGKISSPENNNSLL